MPAYGRLGLRRVAPSGQYTDASADADLRSDGKAVSQLPRSLAAEDRCIAAWRILPSAGPVLGLPCFATGHWCIRSIAAAPAGAA